MIAPTTSVVKTPNIASMSDHCCVVVFGFAFSFVVVVGLGFAIALARSSSLSTGWFPVNRTDY
jgi:hypothetical protein